jgi:hypothetical protein
MRNLNYSVWLFAAALLSPSAAVADPCRESLVREMSRPMKGQASKSTITTVTSGQKPMINYHFSNGSGDWLTQVIDPPGMPWSLAVGDVLYASSDKGKTWKKVRELNDPGHDPEVVLKQQADVARSAQNIACGFEEIDGVRLEKFEGDLVYPQMNMTTRQTLWIHPATRQAVKTFSVMRMSGMETAVTQSIEYLSDLTLPKP